MELKCFLAYFALSFFVITHNVSGTMKTLLRLKIKGIRSFKVRLQSQAFKWLNLRQNCAAIAFNRAYNLKHIFEYFEANLKQSVQPMPPIFWCNFCNSQVSSRLFGRHWLHTKRYPINEVAAIENTFEAIKNLVDDAPFDFKYKCTLVQKLLFVSHYIFLMILKFSLSFFIKRDIAKWLISEGNL